MRTPLALVGGGSGYAGSPSVDWYDVRRGVPSMDEDNAGRMIDLAEYRAEMVGADLVVHLGVA